MASPTISIDIVADPSRATSGLRAVSDEMDRVEAKSRSVSGGIESIGDTAGRATTGLRDMSDAVAMAGFPEMAAGMGIAATGLESLDGAANLYKASQEAITKGGTKLIEMMKGTRVATLAMSAAQTVAAAATTAFGTAMNFLKVAILTNPIFWIVAIIVAIVAAFVLLYMKCETFREIVDKVFSFVWNLIKNVWEWIKSAFAALLDILRKPFDVWMTVAKTVFDWIKNAIKAVVDWIGDKVQAIVGFFVGVWEKVTGTVQQAVKKVVGFIEDIKEGAQNVVDKVKEIFAKVYDWITAPFRKAMDWISDHVKLPKIDLPFIGGKAAPALAPTVAGRAGAASGGRAAGGVTVIVNGPISTHDTVRELRRLLREDQARLGRASVRGVLA